MLGLYVSDHPLTGLEHVLANAADCTDRPAAHRRGPARRLARDHLRPDHRRHPQDHQDGNAWAIVTVEDLEGAIDVLLFPSDYQLASTCSSRTPWSRAGPPRQEQGPVRAARQVGLDAGDGRPRQRAGADHAPLHTLHPPVVEQLKEVLRTHPGTTEVRLRLVTRGATRSCDSTTGCGSPPHQRSTAT
jgi:DNA polymerase-3 subunit alpha